MTTIIENIKPKRGRRSKKEIEEAKQNVVDANARKKISDMGYKKGGSVSSASKRADGCCTKGKTKGAMITMYGGGKC